jgi:hypothetical protein
MEKVVSRYDTYFCRGGGNASDKHNYQSMESMDMKLVTGIVASLVIGSLSFGAFAAKELQRDEAKKMNLTKVGDVSTSDTTAPMDAKKELSQKADEMGGTYYVITSGTKNEKDIRATAEVFK